MPRIDDTWPEYWERVDSDTAKVGSSRARYVALDHDHVVDWFRLHWDLLEVLVDDPDMVHVRFATFDGELLSLSVSRDRDGVGWSCPTRRVCRHRLAVSSRLRGAQHWVAQLIAMRGRLLSMATDRNDRNLADSSQELRSASAW